MGNFYVIHDVPESFVCIIAAEEYEKRSPRPVVHGEYTTLSDAVAECDRVNAEAWQNAKQERAVVPDGRFYARDESGEWEKI